MRPREVVVRACLDQKMLWRHGPWRRQIHCGRVARGLVHLVDQFLHPRRWRRWQVLPQRRRVGDLFQTGIELGFDLRDVGKQAAARRERARFAPAVAIVEDADDESVPNLHAHLDALSWSKRRASFDASSARDAAREMTDTAARCAHVRVRGHMRCDSNTRQGTAFPWV
jgi:hypothetical protein